MHSGQAGNCIYIDGWTGILKMRYTLLCLILEQGLQLFDAVLGFDKGQPQLAQFGHAGP